MNALELLTLSPEQKRKGLWLSKEWEGEHKDWWKNGNLVAHSNWKNKQRHGESKWWTSSGELWHHELYENGIKVKDFFKDQK